VSLFPIVLADYWLSEYRYYIINCLQNYAKINYKKCVDMTMSCKKIKFRVKKLLRPVLFRKGYNNGKGMTENITDIIHNSAQLLL